MQVNVVHRDTWWDSYNNNNNNKNISIGPTKDTILYHYYACQIMNLLVSIFFLINGNLKYPKSLKSYHFGNKKNYVH